MKVRTPAALRLAVTAGVVRVSSCSTIGRRLGSLCIAFLLGNNERVCKRHFLCLSGYSFSLRFALSACSRFAWIGADPPPYAHDLNKEARTAEHAELFRLAGLLVCEP